MSKTTAQLVQLAQQNDQDAIEELYRQTYNSVYQTVKTMVKDDDTALDIVQDSFVKGFDNLNQLNEPEKFSAWMRQIAANRARDYLKKKRPTLFTEMENEDGEMQEFADDCMEHLPEEVLDRAETARLVKEILDTLPEEQRAVIFMMHYEQMTVKEIAQALDCSENTVKSRLKYGREKIKVKVEDAYIKAFQNLHQLDDPDKFPAWVKRIAVNQAKDYLKKKKPILFSEMENEEGDAPEFRDDNMDVQPEAVVDRQDTTELINRILSTLNDDQRIAIVMFYYQESCRWYCCQGCLHKDHRRCSCRHHRGRRRRCRGKSYQSRERECRCT